jgi:hypothetical protein
VQYSREQIHRDRPEEREVRGNHSDDLGNHPSDMLVSDLPAGRAVWVGGIGKISLMISDFCMLDLPPYSISTFMTTADENFIQARKER